MRFTVVGAGSIGKRHIGNLIARGTSPDEIGVVDPRDDRRREVEARFGIEETWKTLDDAPVAQTDVALITSPTALHIEQALPFAQAGATLLIEKPLDATLERAAELLAAVRAHGDRALVAYPFRFSEPARKLRELVLEHAVGRPLYVRGEFSEYLPDWHPWEDYRGFYMARRDLGGGSLLDQSHIMDLAQWLFGGVASAFGFSGRVSDLEVDTDDLAEIQLRFRSGLVGSIHQDMFGRRHKKRLEVMCSEGNLVWDAYDFSVEVYARPSGTTTRYEFARDFQRMYVAELDHLMAIHERRSAPLCTLAEGIDGLRVIEAVRASMASGRLQTLA